MQKNEGIEKERREDITNKRKDLKNRRKRHPNSKLFTREHHNPFPPLLELEPRPSLHSHRSNPLRYQRLLLSSIEPNAYANS